MEGHTGETVTLVYYSTSKLVLSIHLVSTLFGSLWLWYPIRSHISLYSLLSKIRKQSPKFALFTKFEKAKSLRLLFCLQIPTNKQKRKRKKKKVVAQESGSGSGGGGGFIYLMKIEELDECEDGADDGVSGRQIEIVRSADAKRAIVGAGARILFYPTLLYNVLRNKIESEFRWWDQVDQVIHRCLLLSNVSQFFFLNFIFDWLILPPNEKKIN